ncbi:MAG: preprotein translocase subunit SecY [Candidatus Aenigmarchaeota archaeon]|nr:preprotein translocase subunit SecY [Candidatus Aenigmarchaeota archaeon]
MFDFSAIANMLPSVRKPEMRLNFKEKSKWTLLILVIYFVLGSITIWGINPTAVARFDFLEIVFGSKFGSLITLGIGPIVTASIILQLLVGSKIINWNLQDPEDKKKFMGVQKILAITFCFVEAVAYVVAGAIPPVEGTLFISTFVILQLAAGGILIMLMDEVCSKWGFGSGVSLFIAAGVSKTIFVRIFAPPIKEASGGILSAFVSSLGQGMPAEAMISLLPLIATIVVFLIVVFAQDMRIEIPMSFAMPFGKFGSRRWPLKFIYTSNMPVILTAAVIANVQLVGRLLYARGIYFLGEYDLSTGSPTSGLMLYLTHPSSVSLIVVSVLGGVVALLFALMAIKTIKKYSIRLAVVGGIIGVALGYFIVVTLNLPALTTVDALRSLSYMFMMILGSVIFSMFWVMTSGMDAHSVAEQFKQSSIMIPGFRHDPRIVEKVLNRYIPSLTVLGGAFVGFLAGFADLTSAVGTGTGILLTVMIVYQLYEQIASQHMEDMNPALRKFMGE